MLVPLAAARAIHFAATAMVMGVALFQCLAAEPAFRTAAIGSSMAVRAYRVRLAGILWIGLVLTLLSGAGWLLALASKISDSGSVVADSGDVVLLLLTKTQFGHFWMVRALVAGAVFATLWFHWQKLTAAAAVALMGSLAWSGHAAGSPGTMGDVHLIADILHLIAAGAWLGGLASLALLFGMAIQQTDPSLVSSLPIATQRFSTLGLLSVGALFVTGLINAWMLAGSLPNWLAMDYGRLLLLKIGLFIAMVIIAGINRFRLTPRLPNKEAVRRLDRNARAELAMGLAIIAIVSILGVLPPTSHMGMQMH
jgi:putative copper resistance protein D